MRGLTGTLLLALAMLTAGCTAPAPDRAPADSTPVSARPTPPAATPRSPAQGGRLLALLGRVRVVPDTAYRPGYDRRCDDGHACVFGPLWTDDHPGPFGGNGCDTRQDVLLRQLRDVEMRWGSRCRVYDGVLDDPYTGRRLTWRTDGYDIQVDHVYPLAEAWHAGAWAWSQRRRVRFANDVRRELLAVSADANQDKGAATPAEWLPPDRAGRCGYLEAYLRVAAAYDLPVTDADAAVVRRVARRC